VKSPNVSIWCTKFTILAHPPNPKPTIRTHTTINTLITNVPTHLPTNLGGCSTAFCIRLIPVKFNNKNKMCTKVCMIINEINYYYDINNAEINVVSKKCQKDWIFLEKVSGMVWSGLLDGDNTLTQFSFPYTYSFCW